MVEHLRAGEEAAAQRIDAVKSDPTVDPSEPVTIDVANGDEDQSASSLPPLLHKYEPNAEGWIEFDKPVLYLYGGKGPLVGRDFLQFPMSLPDDGYVDIVIQERVCAIFDLSIHSILKSAQVNRREMLKAMDGAEIGKTYWMDSVSTAQSSMLRVC